MKLSAQIRHKSHSVVLCPLNHYSVRLPGLRVLRKHANMFFFSAEAALILSLAFKFCELKI